MNDPGQHRLWSIPGDGVLARQGNLVLLSSIEDGGFAESLLELLARTSEAGGDGRALADAIGAAAESHQSWGGLQIGPAMVAFGPAGAGLAFTVSGTAFVEITTAHGTHRLVAGHPSMLLRSVVALPVQSVRGGLGGNGPGDRTDRFTRLDSGTVRAWGLSYHLRQPGHPGDVSPAAPPAPPPAAVPAPQPPAAVPAPFPAGFPAAFPAPAPAQVPPVPAAGTAPAPPPAQVPPEPAPPATPPPFQVSPAGAPPAAPPPFRFPSALAPEAPGTEGAAPADPYPAGEHAEGPPPFEGAPAGRYAEGPPPFEAGPAGRYAEGPPPFEAGPAGPAEPAHGPPAPAEPPRYEPDPVAQALERHGLAGPPPGEPGAADPVPGPAPYDPGLAEPEIPPPPAPQTALDPAARPPQEAPPDLDDTAPEPAESGAQPVVLGVYCKNGHFTDPDARSCVACGAGISRRSAAPQRGPRPALGVLVLDDGAAVDVDGDYVIGRDPARDASVSAGEARPLRVVDAGSTVSRVHARVHLDGWNVLLTDLGSANGTRIQPPGAKSELTLDPQAPVPLQHGTRIFVGAPSLRYERPAARQ